MNGEHVVPLVTPFGREPLFHTRRACRGSVARDDDTVAVKIMRRKSSTSFDVHYALGAAVPVTCGAATRRARLGATSSDYTFATPRPPAPTDGCAPDS